MLQISDRHWLICNYVLLVRSITSLNTCSSILELIHDCLYGGQCILPLAFNCTIEARQVHTVVLGHKFVHSLLAVNLILLAQGHNLIARLVGIRQLPVKVALTLALGRLLLGALLNCSFPDLASYIHVAGGWLWVAGIDYQKKGVWHSQK
jgi:hypothetical protein